MADAILFSHALINLFMTFYVNKDFIKLTTFHTFFLFTKKYILTNICIKKKYVFCKDVGLGW